MLEYWTLVLWKGSITWPDMLFAGFSVACLESKKSVSSLDCGEMIRGALENVPSENGCSSYDATEPNASVIADSYGLTNAKVVGLSAFTRVCASGFQRRIGHLLVQGRRSAVLAHDLLASSRIAFTSMQTGANDFIGFKI